MGVNNQICPICATGECQYRNGIMCGAWVCAAGKMKDGKGNAVGGPSDNTVVEMLRSMFSQQSR